MNQLFDSSFPILDIEEQKRIEAMCKDSNCMLRINEPGSVNVVNEVSEVKEVNGVGEAKEIEEVNDNSRTIREIIDEMAILEVEIIRARPTTLSNNNMRLQAILIKGNIDKFQEKIEEAKRDLQAIDLCLKYQKRHEELKLMKRRLLSNQKMMLKRTIYDKKRANCEYNDRIDQIKIKKLEEDIYYLERRTRTLRNL